MMVNKDLSQKLVIISYRLFQGHTQAGLGLALTSDSVRISPEAGLSVGDAMRRGPSVRIATGAKLPLIKGPELS